MDEPDHRGKDREKDEQRHGDKDDGRDQVGASRPAVVGIAAFGTANVREERWTVEAPPKSPHHPLSSRRAATWAWLVLGTPGSAILLFIVIQDCFAMAASASRHGNGFAAFRTGPRRDVFFLRFTGSRRFGRDRIVANFLEHHDLFRWNRDNLPATGAFDFLAGHIIAQAQRCLATGAVHLCRHDRTRLP